MISFSATLVSLISFSRAAVYIVAQCLGGALGALALKAVVSSTIEQTFLLGGYTLSVIAPGPNGPIVTGLAMGQTLGSRSYALLCSFLLQYGLLSTIAKQRH
ncbi:hypothetical protein LOK49_LG14G01065 [Camellia lanceoleosa]|uniref:Uncharacterized protein n=1 Tax=Camellia lanceoleosa TaxID=1840588 RepID=A0ACC0FDT1_9ERIC|nr:hypothetical protein LOK49_LG14G01065 [Camellia lanceoleosa]